MNKTYGKIENGKLVLAKPQRTENPDGSGYSVKYLSDEDAASGGYKEILTRGGVPQNAENLVRAGRIGITLEETENYIIRSYYFK